MGYIMLDIPVSEFLMILYIYVCESIQTSPFLYAHSNRFCCGVSRHL